MSGSDQGVLIYWTRWVARCTVGITVQRGSRADLPLGCPRRVDPVPAGQAARSQGKEMINVQHSAGSPLQVRVSWDGVIATVCVSGELDVISAPALAEDLFKITLDHPERLVLDLDDLVFADVAGARVLDRAVKAFTCPVIIRGLRPSARKLSLASAFGESWGAAQEAP